MGIKRVLCIVLMFAALISANLNVYAKPPGDEWFKVWADEFDDGQVDTFKWSPVDRLDWNQDGKKCLFKRVNVKEEDGCLIIENHWTDHKKSDKRRKEDYSGGWVGSNKYWTYGYFEARTRLEKNDAHFWPTFWIWDTHGHNEFDIMEFSSHSPSGPSQSHHTPNKGNSTTDKSGKSVNKWHEWAVLWSEEEVSFYVDSKKQFSSGDANAAKKDRLHILLTCTPDMNNHPRRSGTYPRFMIDWVRVWKRGDVTSTSSRKKLPVPLGATLILKSNKNGRYLQQEEIEDDLGWQLQATSAAETNTLVFYVGELDNGFIELRTRDYKSLFVDLENESRVYTGYEVLDGTNDEFEWLPQPDGTVAIRTKIGKKYLSVDENKKFQLFATGQEVGPAEKFDYDIK